MAHPKFEKIRSLLEAGEEFSLTESQYCKQTGASLPKSVYYLKKDSALAKIAKQHGFCIEVQEKTICLKKIS